MDRAEERALQVYPRQLRTTVYGGTTCIDDDTRKAKRQGYILGFRQAEMELALTWRDIAHLYAMVGMLTEQEFKGNVFVEALRRFNESRK